MCPLNEEATTDATLTPLKVVRIIEALGNPVLAGFYKFKRVPVLRKSRFGERTGPMISRRAMC